MRSSRLVVPVLLFGFALGACGGDDPTDPGDGGSADFTATIDGAAWASDEVYQSVTAGGSSLPGSLVISGNQVSSSGTTRGILLILGFLEGPGTYPLGVNNATTGGGTGSVTESAVGSSASFLTPLSGDAGSVTISQLGGGKIVGTFAFTGAPIAGGGGSRTVTNGSFDLLLPSGFTAVSGDGRGSTMTATIGGAAWTGATNLAVGTPGAYGLGGSNTEYQVNISTVGTTPDSYSVGTEVSLQVMEVGTTNGWGAAGSTGTVTITGGGTTRSIGTFSGTLQPIGATAGTLTIGNGAFDIALP